MDHFQVLVEVQKKIPLLTTVLLIAINVYARDHVLYLAGAYSTAIKAGFPIFSIAPHSFFLWAVTTAAWTRCAHTVIASWEVHTHTVIPAGVCLQTALVNVWKTESNP